MPLHSPLQTQVMGKDLLHENQHHRQDDRRFQRLPEQDKECRHTEELHHHIENTTRVEVRLLQRLQHQKNNSKKIFFPYVNSSLHTEGGRLADRIYSAICAHDQMCNGERNKHVGGRNLDCSCAALKTAEESALVV